MSASGRLLVRAARSRRKRMLVGKVLRATGGFLPRKPPPRAPIFVIGTPRSGTSMLFDLLNRSPEVASLDAESHLLWEAFHPDADPAWTSHRIEPSAVTRRERRALSWALDRIAGRVRYLDKDPRNCFRIPYLLELFPDARFVFIRRDGRAVVSSLITGWRSAGAMAPGTPVRRPLRVDGYEGTTWRYAVPPGWEEYASGHTLAQVCAFQWVSAVEAVLDAKPFVEEDRWTDVAYEDLARDPGPTLERLLARLDLSIDPRVTTYAASLDRRPVRAVTPPRPDKWREENPSEIAEILDTIAPTMRRLGYDDGTPGKPGTPDP